MSLVRRLAESGDGETLVLAVVGEVDLASSPELATELRRHAHESFSRLVLDLTDLEFIDSSGIRVLFELAALLRQHGQGFRLIVPRDAQPWPALQISGVERVAEISHAFEGLTGEATSGGTG